MAHIAVIGPGAIGGTVAAWLSHAGHDVAVCARTPFDRIEVDGPAGHVVAHPHVLTDPADARPVDWAIAATKTYDRDGALAWLAGLVGPHTRVAVLQNGVEHRARFAGKIDDTALVPAIVDIPAERTAPGRILQRRAGSIIVPDDAAGRAFAALLDGTPIAGATTPDFVTTAWRKLAINCAGAVNAILFKPAGITHDAHAAAAMRQLIAECIAVGRAEGAVLPDALIDEVIDGYRAAAPDSLNSLHADRLAGRPMEIDARNGVIVRLGERHGIPSPANRLVVDLLSVA